MTAFVLGGWWLWKLLNELELDIYAQFAGLLIYGLNPNLLYMQATPMTESLLICLGLGTVYYLACWAKQERIIDLVTAGGLTFLSTLTRYDGWFLLLFSTIFNWRKPILMNGAVFSCLRDPSIKELKLRVAPEWRLSANPTGYLRTYIHASK